MQQQLIIYLSLQDALTWVTFEVETGIKRSGAVGNAEELAQLAANKEVIIVVSAQDVLLASAKLPKMNRSRLAQALPYALEEQLIGDVELLHFAPAESEVEGVLPVAIVAKEKMQAWKDVLQNWNIKADSLVSQVFTLPVQDKTWTLVLQEMAILRMGNYQGFACDINNINEMLNIALQSADHLPQCLHIYNYTANSIVDALNLSANTNTSVSENTNTEINTSVNINKNTNENRQLNSEVIIKEDLRSPEKFYTDLVANITKFPHIDLLQGAYKTKAKKSKLPATRKLWDTMFYLAAAWICLLFLYPTISYFILKQRLHGIDGQIAAIYKHYFPQSSTVVAPKLRMEEKMQRVAAKSGDSKSLLLIGYVGKAMTEAHNIQIKRMDFQNNQLTIELSAASSQEFSQFTDFLSHQGLNVKQQGANLSGERVNSSIVIE
jgi:general secretion pathway protein L